MTCGPLQKTERHAALVTALMQLLFWILVGQVVEIWGDWYIRATNRPELSVAMDDRNRCMDPCKRHGGIRCVFHCIHYAQIHQNLETRRVGAQ